MRDLRGRPVSDNATVNQFPTNYDSYLAGSKSAADLMEKYPALENAFAAQVAYEGVYDDPPTVLACINKLASTHNAVSKSKVFCVNVLRAEDWQLSSAFSGAQSGDSRFKNGNWTRLATGAPVLIEALVSFDCRVVKTLAHGSHTVFLGQVEQMLIGQKGKPLLYSEGQYAKLASLTLGEPLPEGLDYWGF